MISTTSCLPECLSPLRADAVCPRFDQKHYHRDQYPQHQWFSVLLDCATCVLPLVNHQTAVSRLLGTSHRRPWLLFVGDSDTRGLVLELLQVIASGFHGFAAARESELWLGMRHVPNATIAEGRLSQAKRSDWLRKCLLDFEYNHTGHVLSARSLHCRSYVDYTTHRNGYVSFGKDYNFTSSSSRAAALRVTFVGTESINQTIASLRALAAEVSRSREPPTALYVGVGAWFKDKKQTLPLAPELVVSMDRLAETLPQPRAQTFATVIGQANRDTSFDNTVLPLLIGDASSAGSAGSAGTALPAPPRARPWRIFERATKLSYSAAAASMWAPTASKWNARGLFATSGHAPPLVNYVDVQRLIAANAFSPAEDRHAGHWRHAGEAETEAMGTRSDGNPHNTSATCVRSHRLMYSPWCAGIGTPELGGNGFLEAYFHFCNVSIDIVAMSGAPRTTQ